jgi:hypothetical protein
MVTSGVVILQDNARPLTAARTGVLLKHFNWKLFDYPPYSLYPALSYYHLFTYLKNWLRLQSFNNSEELMEGAKTWLSKHVADSFDIGMEKHIPQYDECLKSGGDDVEK